MEDYEKTGETMNGHSSAKKRLSDNDLSSNSSGLLNASSLTNGSLLDQETPKKRKLKIKFSLDDGGVEELPIDNEIQQSDLVERKYSPIPTTEPTVPSLKIKLFQNSSGKLLGLNGDHFNRIVVNSRRRQNNVSSSCLQIITSLRRQRKKQLQHPENRTTARTQLTYCFSRSPPVS